jgi:hypothetical protein
MSGKTVPVILSSLALGATLVFAGADWQKAEPSEWTSDDVYQILNNSPWSKTVKTTVTNPKDQLGGDQPSAGNTSPNPGTWGNSGQMPGMGGMGRRGMGGYGNSGTYGGRSSNGGTNRGNTSSQGATEVTIQWQSALPVQIATAKKADVNSDFSKIKPDNEYVVAVIGLPVRAIGGRAASVDSDQTTDEEEAKNLENRLKESTALLASGHDPLHPTKVELNQGADGRILLYFPKTDPITVGEKTVEFRLTAGHTEIKKKFALKDMEYHGKLEL